jgi:GNAT superfamily N-acetyltransferase
MEKYFEIRQLDYNNPLDCEYFGLMVQKLYQKESAEHTIPPKNFLKTIDFLSKNTNMGVIYLLFYENKIIGYSILIFYWHNEYGGLLLNIDELFVEDTHRGKGIGKFFFQWIEKKYPEIIGLALEVSPSNTKAIKLYEKLGFNKRYNQFMLKLQKK